MEGWIAAIGSTLVAIITGVWAFVTRREESRDRKAERVEAAQAELIATYKADAETERERRADLQAQADDFEREVDRLRDLLRVFVTWKDNGAAPPPPDIHVTDLWEKKQ